MADFIGQSIGKYLILEQLGEGGVAFVYKALDRELDRDVAVKFLRQDVFGEEDSKLMLKRFTLEARLLAKLSHPNILPIHDYGEHNGQLYLITSYMSGGSLKKRLNRKYSWEEALNIVGPIARALEYAHSQNIMHRDVKPANILLAPGDIPVLADFGLAKLVAERKTMTISDAPREDIAELTGENVSMGTPDYMAPEQIAGKAEFRSDIYSLGVVLYELIAGRRPFVADGAMDVLLMHMNDPVPALSSFASNIPVELERVIMRTLEKKPGDRFSSMSAFATALQKSANVSDDRTRLFVADVPAYLQGQTGEVFKFKTDMTTIGRKNVNRGVFVDIDLTTLDTEKIVSRKHAVIEQQNGKYYLRDEGSVNGTWLNGQRLLTQRAMLLKNGDEICFGKNGVKLTFCQK